MNTPRKIFIIIVFLAVLIIAGAFLIKGFTSLPIGLPFPAQSGITDQPFISEQDLATPSAITSTKLNKPPAGCIPAQPLSIDELTRQSEEIVQGKIEKITPQQDGNGPIYTLVNLKVSESFKNQLPDTVTIKIWGGTIGSITHQFSCQPKFSENEEVIVFLEKDPNDSAVFRVFANYQGKFTSLETSLDELKTDIKAITKIKSFIKNTINQLLSLLIPEAHAAWKLLFVNEGGVLYGVRWAQESIPVQFVMHSTPNYFMGNATYDIIKTAISWWNNAGAGSLVATPSKGESYAFGNNINEIYFTDPGDGRISYDEHGANVNFMDTKRSYDCSVIIETSGYQFCKLLEVDILMLAVSEDLVAQQIGFALGLDDPNPYPEATFPPRTFDIMNSQSLIYPGLSGLSQDDQIAIRTLYPPTSATTNVIDAPNSVGKSTSTDRWPTISINTNTSSGGGIYLKSGDYRSNGDCSADLCTGWTQVATVPAGSYTTDWDPNLLSLTDGTYTFALFDENVLQIFSTDITNFYYISTVASAPQKTADFGLVPVVISQPTTPLQLYTKSSVTCSSGPCTENDIPFE